ncbi:MAG TPA: hypothetical protein VF534_04375 [Paraburkholderia sp.]
MAIDNIKSLVQQHGYSPDNWAHSALLLMDEAESLIRWGSVSAEPERYKKAAKAFWDVCHLLAAERTRIAALVADSEISQQNEGEQSMQDACATLPEGYLIEVNLENGAGWVELYRDGEKVEFDEDTDDGMTGRIRAATDAAIAASAEQKGQS